MRSCDDGRCTSPRRSTRATASATSRSSTCRATARAASACGAASDRLALSNDCFALFDPALPRPGRPRIPHPTFNWSTERVPESIEKLAALEPRTCWPGHYGPLTGDVAAQLRAIG